MGHLRTRAPQRMRRLLDHLVGAGDQGWGHDNAEDTRGLEIDLQLHARGLFDGKLCRLCALQNAVHITRGLPPHAHEVDRVRHRPPCSTAEPKG